MSWLLSLNACSDCGIERKVGAMKRAGARRGELVVVWFQVAGGASEVPLLFTRSIEVICSLA